MIEIAPIEPNRVKLIWQSNTTDRNKYVVGELVRSGEQVSLSYARYSEDYSRAVQSGFVGHPAFPLASATYHQNVIEVFSRRIPPKTRGDFGAYLAKNRLKSSEQLSDLSILAYTGAYLPSDGFSFAVDWRYQDIPFIFLMEISGFRYHGGMNLEMSSMLNQRVAFTPEPFNPHDPQAIKVSIGDIQIGYVPRYYRQEFATWLLLTNVYAHIERIDGALLNPKVHLFVAIGLPMPSANRLTEDWPSF